MVEWVEELAEYLVEELVVRLSNVVEFQNVS